MSRLRPYYFGIYHWRSRFRRLFGALAALGIAALVGRRSRSPLAWPLVSLVAVGAAIRAGRTLRKLFSPPPWALERYKYDALAEALPLSDADRLLDVGCGTGRSLVGLAPHVPASCSAVGLDAFDDRVILGNGPALARRNARTAGMAVEPVRGDAASLPIATGSQDVVTACRVLHDLPGEAVDPALRECARVCAPGGTLGVLELPIVPDGVDRDPASYWRQRVSAAGFRVERFDRLERTGHDGAYLLIVATPAE